MIFIRTKGNGYQSYTRVKLAFSCTCTNKHSKNSSKLDGCICYSAEFVDRKGSVRRTHMMAEGRLYVGIKIMRTS